MADQAAHLVDHVLPHVPVRQWVLSLPFDLRALVAFRGELRKLVLREFMRAVYRWLRAQARDREGGRLHCGGVIFVQRFGSDLRLNLHFHALVFDGVYSESTDDDLVFLEARAPEPDDLRAISARIHRRLARIFEREGISIGGQIELETDAEDELLLQLASASAAGMIAQGPRSGQRVPPRERRAPEPMADRNDASAGGFNLHAGVVAREDDRQGLERLCRYIARPPICGERLELISEGLVRYHFRRPWRNGRSYVDYSPLELIERLVPLIPLPRTNLLVYHGILAPNARLRSAVVPGATEDPEGACCPGESEREREGEDFPTRRRQRLSWAQLLKRVFGIDALECPNCPKGRLQLIAFITTPNAIIRILESLDLPTRAPPIAPARFSEQEELIRAGYAPA